MVTKDSIYEKDHFSNRIYEFLKAYDIKVNNFSFYKIALTHPSINNIKNRSKKDKNDYQLLEFLGDSILQFLSSRHLFNKYYDTDPGQLTLMRARLVGTKSLNNQSESIGLKNLLRTINSNMRDEILKSQKVGADIFESFVAAIYLDHNIETVKKFLMQNLLKDINFEGIELKDSKTKFQEEIQTFSRKAIVYQTVNTNKGFYCKAMHDNKVFGEGYGINKLDAEEAAASDALRKLADSK
ncbi:ribonuclease III [Mycoplasmopsis opalescens]|uniref:ribonuclease III n=1 Tax=Mycoplasmopsis opalescens TaxID=114886 RepID=UPI0009FFC957|nr:ribonuclease III [Mycoplasmopsis opalescens]